MISKRLHPASFSNVNAQLAKSMSQTPIATYTHSGNKEVVVSAIDFATDIFTSVAHGLISNEIVYAISNIADDVTVPRSVMPNGITPATPLYVIRTDNDHFQLSTSPGPGVAIDVTTKTTIDLAKWHLQKASGNVDISNLPNISKCLVRISGKGLRNTTPADYVIFRKTDTDILGGGNQVWYAQGLRYNNDINARSLFDYSHGDVYTFTEFEVDFSGAYAMIDVKQRRAISATDTTITATNSDGWWRHKTDGIADFDTIRLSGLSNGMKIEVWKR